jgi:hypothetical protein
MTHKETEMNAQNPTLYITNPDVVLREEEPDGALLFNPDTNQIRVLNPTGLFIWRLCDGSRDLPAMVAGLRESFDAVPEDQVASQVTTFIDEMLAAGFIGIVEDQAA